MNQTFQLLHHFCYWTLLNLNALILTSSDTEALQNKSNDAFLQNKKLIKIIKIFPVMYRQNIIANIF